MSESLPREWNSGCVWHLVSLLESHWTRTVRLGEILHPALRHVQWRSGSFTRHPVAVQTIGSGNPPLQGQVINSGWPEFIFPENFVVYAMVTEGLILRPSNGVFIIGVVATPCYRQVICLAGLVGALEIADIRNTAIAWSEGIEIEFKGIAQTVTRLYAQAKLTHFFF